MGRARRAGAGMSQGAGPFRGFVDLQPFLQARAGERLLVLGPRSHVDAALAARAVQPGGSAVPFLGPPPFPFPDGHFDVALVAGPVGGAADAALVAHELFRVLAPGGRAVLVSAVVSGGHGVVEGVPGEAALMALLDHCGFAALKILARRGRPSAAGGGPATVLVAMVRPR